jgi:hypothetical protein
VAISCGNNSAAGWFGPDAGFSGGSASSTTSTIDMSGLTNPAPHAVYQNNRYGTSTYTIPSLTPNSTYRVRLHFAESYWTAPGQRTFNVSINGVTQLSNFDIFAAAGGQNKAVIRDLYAAANSSGQMIIQFTTVVNNAQINGIEVLKPQPLVPVGLSAATDNTQVTLTWLPCDGASSYNIYRSSTSGGPYTLISTPASVTETGYIDSTVTSGSTWFYVITAVNAYGESGKSSEVSASLIPAVLPPVVLSVAVSPTNIVLSWPSGDLVSSTNLTGPWDLVGGAMSPYSVTPSEPQRFYRVKSQ